MPPVSKDPSQQVKRSLARTPDPVNEVKNEEGEVKIRPYRWPSGLFEILVRILEGC